MLLDTILLEASFGPLGAGIGVGLVVLGTGLGVGKIGGSAAEAIARQPEAVNDIRTTSIIFAALVEGLALFGAVICFLAMG